MSSEKPNQKREGKRENMLAIQIQRIKGNTCSISKTIIKTKPKRPKPPNHLPPLLAKRSGVPSGECLGILRTQQAPCLPERSPAPPRGKLDLLAPSLIKSDRHQEPVWCISGPFSAPLLCFETPHCKIILKNSNPSCQR